MIHFTDGSQVEKLVRTLSFVGEFPYRSLHLLGNVRTVKELIGRLVAEQEFVNGSTGERRPCRLLSVSGKGEEKTVRLYKAGLCLMDWIHPGAYGYYMDSFHGHRFPGDAAHRERNHRVAEAAAVCMGAGAQAAPYLLPGLQNVEIKKTVPDQRSFYLARDIKRVGDGEIKKNQSSRMAGALFAGGSCYAVYNTRHSVMKWRGMGEFKAMHHLSEIARMNAGMPGVESAVLIGRDGETALRTMLESEKGRRLEFRFDGIYRHVHFIGMDGEGVRQLRMLCVPGWERKVRRLLFEDGELTSGGLSEYDATVNGTHVFSHLDGDLARLWRLKQSGAAGTGSCEVLCFPHQLRFLREYLGRGCSYKTIDMELVEEGLGIKGQEQA